MSLSQYGAFIHHKWNWNTSIDLTRNLTKFAPRTKASNSVPKRKNKKSSRTLANQSDFDDVEEIDQNAIIGVLLNKVDESRDDISGEANSSLEQSEVSQANHFLNPNCKFCTSICHCSPGRQLKRPYHVGSEDFEEQPTLSKPEKILRLENVHEEVRDGLNCHISNFCDPDQYSNNKRKYYTNVATNVLASTNEAFELFSNYRKNPFDFPNFTPEQVRELLSVELAQDKFNRVYKSPYGNHGKDDDKESSDDDDDDDDSNDDDNDNGDDQQEKKMIDNGKETWSKSTIESY